MNKLVSYKTWYKTIQAYKLIYKFISVCEITNYTYFNNVKILFWTIIEIVDNEGWMNKFNYVKFKFK